MATLNSLAADVATITNRPDLVAEMKVAIRKAIMKFHQADTFSRDLSRTRLQMALYTPIEPNTWRYLFDLTNATLFPRFRRIQSLNYPVDLVPQYTNVIPPLRDYSVLNSDSRQIKVIASDNLFDSYLTERAQYAYITGSSLNVKLGWGMDYIDVFFYQYPLIPSDPETQIISWIVDQFPDAVIEESCNRVFAMIGKDEESGRYERMFAENLAMLRETGVGEDAQ